METNLLMGKRMTSSLLFFSFLLFNLSSVLGQNYCGSTPVSVHGNLSVNGTKIVDQTGNPVSFAGNSFFWSNNGWGAEAFYNSNVVEWLKDDWNTTLVRAAMGVEDSGGYISNPNDNKQRVITIVDAAIAEGLYVIIDWHSHHAEDNEAAAISFFQEMATLYGNNPNVIYEIYNEPLQVSWSNTIKPYAENVISAIRAIDPDNLIIVGTPTWSQDVDDASNDPITTSTNIAYTLHFYAATHKASLRAKAQTAINNGIALFVTEWGTVSADGNGGVDATSTDEWMSFLAANDISHANWAMNNKNEGASSIVPSGSSTGGWSASDLTTSGTKVKSIIENWQQYCNGGGNVSPTVSISNPQNNSIASEGDVINIEANASDFDGTVTQVEFFADGTSLGIDTTSPYSFAWSPLEGNYTLTAVATDNESDSTTSTPIDVDVFGPNGGTDAYPNGVAHDIPGTINAVNFDIGGEDVAYNDTDSGNNGPGIRADENVDTGTYSQGGTVGWIAGGEWLNFTVDVQTAGTYDIVFDVASALNGSNFHLEFNGQDVTGQIGVSSTGGWGDFVTIDVQDVLLDAGLQTMRIAFDQGPFNLGNLYFTLDQPTGNQAPSVSIFNPIDGDDIIEGTTVLVTASASDSDGTVTNVDFYIDGVLEASDTSAPYTFSWSSTAIGTHTIYAIATDDDGDATQSTSIDVDIIVEPANVLPTVSVTSPTDGDDIIEGTTVSITASASDSDGTVTGVDFYVDGVLEATDSSSPYSISWSSTAIGAHTIYAIATDDDGDTTQSASIDVDIIPEPANVPPTVSVTSPTDGDDIIEGTTVSITASASDSDGTVTSVDFYVDGVLESTDSSSPYSISWSSTAIGAHTIYAIATDDDGDTTQSASIDVDIIPEPANVPPTVSVTSPTDGDDIIEGTTVLVTASASDSDGTVTGVGFYVDGVLESTDSSSPYSISWSSTAVGSHTIYAIATDDDGDTTQSASIDVDITPEPANVPPTVSITNPSNGDEFVDGTTVSMSATASDSDGSVTSVDFYVDGVLESTDSSSPYTFNWTNGAIGTYTIYGVATDDDGDTTQSASIDIDIIEDSSGGCDFGAPQSNGLASTNTSYNNIHVLGNGGPNLSNVSNFTINWDLQNNGLYQFSMLTNNGQPNWWNNLLGSVTRNLNSSQPELSLSGTGFSGLDGDYWATLDGGNFVLVSKTGGFTIYFSNSSTPPNCNSSRGIDNTNAFDIETIANSDIIKIYPNPVENDLLIDFGNNKYDHISIISVAGKVVYQNNIKSSNISISIPVNRLKKGTYIINLSIQGKTIVKKFVKN